MGIDAITAKSVINRLQAMNTLLEMETSREKGEAISEYRIATLYIKILHDRLISALKVMTSKDVASILAVTAKIDMKVAQKAIYYFKSRVNVRM